MSFEQLEKIFPIDSKVILINDEGFFKLLAGMKGIITGYNNLIEGEVLEIEWETGEIGVYFPWRVKPIFVEITFCPRSGKELEEKSVQISLFSEEKETINKCERCGWC